MADDYLKKGLQLLKSAESDNERFAALMMVTKVVQTQECKDDARKQILDALGLKFLTRLLKTKLLTESEGFMVQELHHKCEIVPTHHSVESVDHETEGEVGSVPEGCPGNIYRSLALSILASFCQDELVMSDAEMKKQLPTLNEIILGDNGDEIADNSILEDCYDTLRGMLHIHSSRQYILDAGTVCCCVEVIVSEKTGHEKSLQLLLEMCRLEGGKMWDKKPSSAHKLMIHLVSKFKQKQDLSKFEMTESLTQLLPTVPKVEQSGQSTWVPELVEELGNIFKSKLGTELRNSALCLISAFVSSQGVECLLPPTTENSKVLLLVIHLACVEIRMTLEDGRLEHILSKAGILCSCYSLLENIIGHMTTAPSMGLDEKQVLQLHTAMLAAFNSIIFFLTQVDQKVLDVAPQSILVVAAVRVLGVWLAEETSALREEIYSLLPFLVRLCQKSDLSSEDPVPCMSNLSISEPNHQAVDDRSRSTSHQEEEGGTRMITDADRSADHSVVAASVNQGSQNCPVSSVREEESETSLSNDKVPKSTYLFSDSDTLKYASDVDLVRFLLPAFCHLTSEDKPREILLGENIHVTLLHYFRSLMTQLHSNPCVPTLQDSIASLCGIFLNLVVTEPQLVATHHVFQELLVDIQRYLKNSVHDSELLVLTANFVTLGLMLLHKQTDRKDIPWEDNNQFLAGCISFLSRAHSIAGKKSSHSFVSELYIAVWEDISELWYLSMQSICVLASEFPGLVALILKSGWIPALIRMLLEPKGEGMGTELRSSYRSLLMTLAREDKQAKRVIFEKRGLDLAHMYKWDDLEMMLVNT